MHSAKISEVAKARHSYRLRPGLARSARSASKRYFTPEIALPSTRTSRLSGYSGPRPFAAHVMEFHRAVRYGDPEGGADGAFHEVEVATMGADQFGGNGQPEPAAVGPARALESLEQVVAGFLRNARPGVGNLQDGNSALAPPGNTDLLGRGIALRPAFQRLLRVAHQIEQHAEQLIWVSVDGEPTFDRADPGDRGIRAYSCGFPNLRDNGLDRHHAAIGRCLLRAAIGQRRLAKGDGALQRAHQLRRKALDPRIGHAGDRKSTR